MREKRKMIDQKTAHHLLELCELTLRLITEDCMTHENFKPCDSDHLHLIDRHDTGFSGPLSSVLSAAIKEARANDRRSK